VIQLYIAVALSVVSVGTWVYALRLPIYTPQSQLLTYHIVPFLIVWLIALLTPAHEITFYKGAILMGMLMAIIGLALHDFDFLPSYVAHAFLTITYILYAYAFSSQTSGWPTPWALLLLAAAAAIYYWLYPTLHELWISVAIYSLFIFLATWQALELTVQHPAACIGWAALGGMLLAIAATLVEAQGRFLNYRPAWIVACLPLFFLAQLAIAWSIWG